MTSFSVYDRKNTDGDNTMLEIMILLVGGVSFASMFGFETSETGDPSEIDEDDGSDEDENKLLLKPTIDTTEARDEIEVSLSEADLNELPSPLADWTQTSDVFHLDGQGDANIHFELPDDTGGHIIVIDADIVELTGNEAGDAQTTYFGQNVFFVPEGADFPSEYEWSETGGTLYNQSTYVSSLEDFGEIKFIARIETGSSAPEDDSLNGKPSNLVDANISSNLEISFQ